eukprot:scaffold7263_cov18-Tisochrysis_lutea.AAC.1
MQTVPMHFVRGRVCALTYKHKVANVRRHKQARECSRSTPQCGSQGVVHACVCVCCGPLQAMCEALAAALEQSEEAQASARRDPAVTPSGAAAASAVSGITTAAAADGTGSGPEAAASDALKSTPEAAAATDRVETAAAAAHVPDDHPPTAQHAVQHGDRCSHESPGSLLGAFGGPAGAAAAAQGEGTHPHS